EVSSDQLVQLALDPPSTAGIAMQSWRSADGLIMPGELHDGALDSQCYPVKNGDGYVCMPFGTAIANFQADPGCTQPLGEDFPCEVFPFIQTFDSVSCRTRIFTHG